MLAAKLADAHSDMMGNLFLLELLDIPVKQDIKEQAFCGMERRSRRWTECFDPISQDALKHNRCVKACGQPKQLDQGALAKLIAVVEGFSAVRSSFRNSRSSIDVGCFRVTRCQIIIMNYRKKEINKGVEGDIVYLTDHSRGETMEMKKTPCMYGNGLFLAFFLAGLFSALVASFYTGKVASPGQFNLFKRLAVF